MCPLFIGIAVAQATARSRAVGAHRSGEEASARFRSRELLEFVDEEPLYAARKKSIRSRYPARFGA